MSTHERQPLGATLRSTAVPPVLIRDKTEGDGGACLELLQRVRQADTYPLYLPDDIAGFITPEDKSAAWVADADGVVVGYARCTK